MVMACRVSSSGAGEGAGSCCEIAGGRSQGPVFLTGSSRSSVVVDCGEGAMAGGWGDRPFVEVHCWQVFGQSRPWASRQHRAAMRQLLTAQSLVAVNGRFIIGVERYPLALQWCH